MYMIIMYNEPLLNTHSQDYAYMQDKLSFSHNYINSNIIMNYLISVLSGSKVTGILKEFLGILLE